MKKILLLNEVFSDNLMRLYSDLSLILSKLLEEDVFPQEEKKIDNILQMIKKDTLKKEIAKCIVKGQSNCYNHKEH